MSKGKKTKELEQQIEKSIKGILEHRPESDSYRESLRIDSLRMKYAIYATVYDGVSYIDEQTQKIIDVVKSFSNTDDFNKFVRSAIMFYIENNQYKPIG